ncbi:MAG TPA: thiamine pyrophosphate-dependent enzyme, partial [Rhodocyclaceae bacterium]|nr:thiamine pyrophosphate-dependent enzyme [Rhodocyclaceae bacterium]
MEQLVKFYQTGTFTVGNRLLAENQRSVQANMQRTNSLNSGHRACQGCGEALGARYAIDAAMHATDNQLIAANATGCLEVFSTPYPETSWQIPWIHSLFGNTAAVATGIAAAMRVKGRKDVRVIAQGGDGGTTDIGFGCLSGMFERNDDVLYICYDNEAYMNTGVQRSSATPPAARTATTMPVGPEPGNVFGQGKNLPRIAMAHGIPYVATATVAELRDLEYKVKRAMSFRGARYIHIYVPCPLGWGTASNETIKMARLVKDTGLFPVYEAEHGEVVSVSKIRRQLPVEEYLKPQKRFAHLFGKQPRYEVIAR